MAFQTAGDDPCYRLVAITHKHLFAVPDELNMGAELRFQIANINGSHGVIIADMTMLVTSAFLLLKHAGQEPGRDWLAFVQSIVRFFKFLPGEERKTFLSYASETRRDRLPCHELYHQPVFRRRAAFPDMLSFS